MHKVVGRMDKPRHREADPRQVIDVKPTLHTGFLNGPKHDVDELFGMHAGVGDGELLAHHIIAFKIQHQNRNDLLTDLNARDQMRLGSKPQGDPRPSPTALGLCLGNDLFDQPSAQQFRSNGRHRCRAKASGGGNVDSCDFTGGPDRVQNRQSTGVALFAYARRAFDDMSSHPNLYSFFIAIP